jgi:putative membrane protein
MSSEPAQQQQDQQQPLPAPPPEGVPLLQGNLHPAVLILRLIDALRQSLVLAVIGVVADWRILIAAGVVFLFVMGHGLVRYLTFHYRLTAVELITREGILNRQERRIPIDRVQDLGFESTILRRALGVTVVRVETASGQGAEAVLDSLGRGHAEHLREVLLQQRAARGAPLAPPAGGGAVPVTLPRAEPEWTVYTADAGMLLLRGLTDLRVSAIVVAAVGAAQLADQLGLVAMMAGAGDSFFTWLRAFPLAFAALVLLLAIAAVLAASVALAALTSVMVFHGFRLALRADTLLCRYGLLTTRQKTLPRVRVQRVRVEQTWLRRLVGVATARADSAGSGRGVGDEAPGGFDVVVPMARLPRIDALLPALLPGLAPDVAPVRASPRLVLRVFLKGTVWLLLAAGTALPYAGPVVLWALLLLPLPWIVGRLAWQNLGFALWPQHLFLRWGVLGRYQVLMPTAKVQAVAVLQGPLQRLLGLCDLSVFVAGGPPTRLPDLDIADARPLLRELARRATAAAVGDWRPAAG